MAELKDSTINGNPVWHAGNDGTGSGLDADTLDGQHASYFYSPANPPSTTFTSLQSTTVANLNTNAVAGSIAYVTDNGGGIYYKNSSSWSLLSSKYGTINNPASTSTHVDITSNPSGWYYINDPFNNVGKLSYVYNSYDGGGWLLVMNIPSWVVPTTTNYMWDNTSFWCGNTTEGTPGGTAHYDQIFKSWAWNSYTPFNEIMIQILDGAGNILGYGVYNRLSTYAGQSWYNMMNSQTRKVITENRKAQSGNSGAGNNYPQSTVYGFPFTDSATKPGCTNEPISINDQNAKFSADTATYTRIGTTASSDYPTNRGHIVSGGFGVFHRHGSWYGGHVIGPHMDYCTNSGAGQGYRNWGNAGASTGNTRNFYGAGSWADDCVTESYEYASRSARILVR